MKSITVKFDYSHLRNEAHVEYHETVASTFLKRDLKNLGLQTLFDEYQGAFKNEISGLDVVRKSEYTREINEQDIVRDRILRGFSDAVKSAVNHFDTAKKQAAERLEIVVKNYGNIAQKSLDSETAAIDDLIREMNDSHFADIKLLALGDWLTQLENENAAFKKLMEQRYDESAAKPTVVMKSARDAVDAAFRALLNQIDALVLVKGEAEYLPLIKDLNAVSERYKTLLARGEKK